MKREENMKFKKYFFKYLKIHKNSNNIPSISWLGARTCKVLRKYSHAFLSYSAKTKRDGQTDRRTDRRTGGVAISPGPTAPAGDNNR